MNPSQGFNGQGVLHSVSSPSTLLTIDGVGAWITCCPAGEDGQDEDLNQRVRYSFAVQNVFLQQ